MNVDAVVDEYKALKLNPDATDEDMYYLRAYLAVMKQLHPDVQALRAPLVALAKAIDTWGNEVVVGENRTVHQMLEQLGRGNDLERAMHRVLGALKQVDAFTKDIEARHARLILLSKVRSETRLKNSAAEQVQAFKVMLDGLMVILREQLNPADFSAFQQRCKREFESLSLGVVDGSASVKA